MCSSFPPLKENNLDNIDNLDNLDTPPMSQGACDDVGPSRRTRRGRAANPLPAPAPSPSSPSPPSPAPASASASPAPQTSAVDAETDADKEKVKQMLKALERALDKERREQLMAAAYKSDTDLFEACEFVLMLPRGAGIQGVKKDCDGYRKRWRKLCLLLDPSKAQMFPRLVPRLPEFAEAMQMVNAAWQDLEVLLQKSEGTYQPAPCGRPTT